jgi:hypothetical protein
MEGSIAAPAFASDLILTIFVFALMPLLMKGVTTKHRISDAAMHKIPKVVLFLNSFTPHSKNQFQASRRVFSLPDTPCFAFNPLTLTS